MYACTLAALTPRQRPRGNRVLLTSFGGGSGVIGTDQCVREGLAVPPLDDELRKRLAPILTPLASSMNPIDLTPGSVTDPGNRADLPEVLRLIGEAPNVDSFVFMSAGFGKLAPAVVDMVETLRTRLDKPMAISWLSPPPGIVETFAARGVRVFDEHARAIRVTAHVARWAEDMRGRIVHRPELALGFEWEHFVPASVGPRIVSEDVVAAILTAADLPVARGELAHDAAQCVGAAERIGYPVAIKAISQEITHRAAVGLVALHVDSPEAVARAVQRFKARAIALGAKLDGVWVQRMERGKVELLVTAFRDAEFGVMVGCGMGGGMTEIIDDVVFARAPIDGSGASELIGRLRTLRRLPTLLPCPQRKAAASFLARFSALAASAPWGRFMLEVNPIVLGDDVCAAVDGLLVIE
jgi:acetate---CoA ligase (ADP-forming)